MGSTSPLTVSELYVPPDLPIIYGREGSLILPLRIPFKEALVYIFKNASGTIRFFLGNELEKNTKLESGEYL